MLNALGAGTGRGQSKRLEKCPESGQGRGRGCKGARGEENTPAARPQGEGKGKGLYVGKTTAKSKGQAGKIERRPPLFALRGARTRNRYLGSERKKELFDDGFGEYQLNANVDQLREWGSGSPRPLTWGKEGQKR